MMILISQDKIESIACMRRCSELPSFLQLRILKKNPLSPNSKYHQMTQELQSKCWDILWNCEKKEVTSIMDHGCCFSFFRQFRPSVA
mmetsp:Transcript_19501/g.24048  ORF Transcript_19501/g.24048 Transcript_19501/m.24048 type:complete len:87 (+) Transcript_19501:718-978(+)